MRGSLTAATAPARLSRTLFTRRALPPPRTRLGSALRVTVFGAVLVGGYLYISDSRAGFHRWVAVPLLHLATKDDPELAHRIGVEGLKWNSRIGLVKDRGVDEKSLEVEVWGKKLSNPLGMAAGFDKHGEAIDGLFDIGFGYVEIGSVTPVAQPGNPLPRMFRLASTESMINRYGFNSVGHYPVLLRLRSRIREFVHHHALALPSNLFIPLSPAPVYAEGLRPAGVGKVAHTGPAADSLNALLGSDQGRDAQLSDNLGVARSLRDGRLLGINLGKNKTSAPDDVDDYIEGVRTLGPYADVVVVNVSSPNTPGLRGLQRRSVLEELLEAVVKERDGLHGKVKPKVVLKIAPDLSPAEIKDVGEAAVGCKIDGIIVSNTTVQRPEGAGTEVTLAETGGLSGPPLKPLALQALSTLHAFTSGKVPLIGCGGIRTGSDALDFARAGASLVQLYTALGYQGVGLPRQIKDEIAESLAKEGKSWKEVVGSKAMKRDEAEALLAPKPTEGAFEQSVAEARKELDQLTQLLAGYPDIETHAEPSSHAIKAPPVDPPNDGRSGVSTSDGPSPALAVVASVATTRSTDQVSVGEAARATLPDAGGATVAPGEQPTSGFVPSGATNARLASADPELAKTPSKMEATEERGVWAGWRKQKAEADAAGDVRRRV